MGAKTLYLYYIFDAPIERVFQAFIDEHAIPKWMPPYGFTAQIIELDARTGGRFEVKLTDFKTNRFFSVAGEFLAIVPNQFICYTEQFIDSNNQPIGPLCEKTILFFSDFNGTELKLHQTNIAERRLSEDLQLNWQESFSLLELLVND